MKTISPITDPSQIMFLLNQSECYKTKIIQSLLAQIPRTRTITQIKGNEDYVVDCIMYFQERLSNSLNTSFLQKSYSIDLDNEFWPATVMFYKSQYPIIHIDQYIDLVNMTNYKQHYVFPKENPKVNSYQYVAAIKGPYQSNLSSKHLYEIDLYDGLIIWIKTTALQNIDLFHHNNNFYQFNEMKTFGDYTCVLLSRYQIDSQQYAMSQDTYSNYLSEITTVGQNILTNDGSMVLQSVYKNVKPNIQIEYFPQDSWIKITDSQNTVYTLQLDNTLMTVTNTWDLLEKFITDQQIIQIESAELSPSVQLLTQCETNKPNIESYKPTFETSIDLTFSDGTSITYDYTQKKLQELINAGATIQNGKLVGDFTKQVISFKDILIFKDINYITKDVLFHVQYLSNMFNMNSYETEDGLTLKKLSFKDNPLQSDEIISYSVQ